MMSFVRKHPLVTFFVLAYSLSWAYWIPLALAGVRVAPGSRSTHFPGLLGPAVAAFLVAGVTGGRPAIITLGRHLLLISRPMSRFWLYGTQPVAVPARSAARRKSRRDAVAATV
jgi:hypothetical protein